MFEQLEENKIGLENIDSKPIIGIRTQEGLKRYEAFCPHRGGPLQDGTLEKNCLTCPWHGSQFDVESGKLLKGPSTKPLKPY